jgi:hypothetical protein
MRTHRVTPLAACGVAAALASVSCSSRGHSPLGATPSTGDDSGASAASSADDDASAVDPTATADVNPDGVPYPGPPYGRTPRTGSTAGRVIQDFTFLGYPGGTVLPKPARIALANFYDPCNKRYKVVHLNVAAVWCTPCNQETGAMVADADWLAQEGVVVVQALNDGVDVGTGATLGDLQQWIAKYTPTFTEMLDPDPAPVLGGFFKAAEVPWNADIDPRTMEILTAGTGWTGDVRSTMAPALEAVLSAPSYPLPGCN